MEWSGRKALAPLGAPAPQYGLSAGSACAGAKSVGSFTFNSAGLIGSFHHESPSKNSEFIYPRRVQASSGSRANNPCVNTLGDFSRLFQKNTSEYCT
jgi:hypothetical protein